MRDKHKWHKEIKHWANGGEVEYRSYCVSDLMGGGRTYCNWVAVNNNAVAEISFDNIFYEFRIKPEVLRYRVALMKENEFNSHYIEVMVEQRDYKTSEDFDAPEEFVKWITEWTEVIT